VVQRQPCRGAPCPPRARVTVTVDRQLALAREELEFLTWDHPMIYHGIDLITSGDIGQKRRRVVTE